VFVQSGTTWLEQQELTASDAAGGDQFGAAVALSNDTAVIGAPAKNASTGSGYIFVRSGTKWTQHARLHASLAATGDELGYAVAIDGSTVLAGAPGKSSKRGAAYVFGPSGTGWSQQATLTASDGAAGDQFGSSVGVSGTLAVVGAPGKNSSAGAAYTFGASAGSWSQQAELAASDAAAFDNFGSSAACDGSTAVFGAPTTSNGTGTAYVFTNA